MYTYSGLKIKIIIEFSKLYVLFFSVKLPISFNPKVQQHWNQYFGHLFWNNLVSKLHVFLFLSFCDPAAKKEKRHDCFSWELCLVIIMLDGVLFTTIGRESGLKKKLKLVSSGTPTVGTHKISEWFTFPF